MKTDQDNFWEGEFGDGYIERNRNEQLLSSNTAFFSKILAAAGAVDSVLEFGCNIGMNLKAIRNLLPTCYLAGVEINGKAVAELKKWDGIGEVIEGSILDASIEKEFDLSLIKGVLIHLNPEVLADVYKKLYETSRKYICVAEYYNPTPVEISYRGFSDRLFKRDFAGEMLDAYPDLELVDYGFSYHRDPVFPQDDITWFLLKKY